MKRREFLKTTLAGLVSVSAASRALAKPSGGKPEVVVLGFDGVDPRLVQRFLRRGDLPNLARLQRQGTLQPLRSVSPPNSPVAWSTFATGLPPAEHGVFGFLKRDPRTYLPGTSPFTIKGPDFRTAAPRKPSAISHRRGEPFWDALDKAGVPIAMLFVPYAYPPPSLRHGRVIAGLGTPDLRFTNSSFTLFTGEAGTTDRVAGGRIVRLDAAGSTIETHLDGPRGAGKEYLRVPLHLTLDRRAGTVTIALGGKQEQVQEGKRSGWFPVHFSHAGMNLAGRVRFHALAVKKELRLYASPIQISPESPALPLGSPRDWTEQAVAVHGGLPTVGWVHDTSAVNAGVLPKQVFLADLLDTMEGRAELLLREIGSGHARAVLSVFTGTDRASHMFYRDLARRDGGVLRRVYRAMDRIVGQVQKALPPDATLLVLSDHGFHAFDRMLHVNTWLESQGLFTRKQPGSPVKFLRGVDWAGTRAYAMGNGQVYVNLMGREATGCVPTGPKKAVVQEQIRKGLLALTDPATGKKPVRAVYTVADQAAAQVRARAPDLQIAFAPGYRSSWDTSLGGAPTGDAFADNPKAWNGDHAASDVEETPGFLATSTKLVQTDPALVDLAATLLHHFGAKPGGSGRPLLR